ncbi:MULTISPECIES: dihydrofolate reductase family protein [unclassified Devosia]|uniref:dihydrofolate reductase family protein n=1 Tax=unclassified Devosia TaxID=196773 RepID=UPI00155697A3|nr:MULTISPECIES: dihydrofolate reductase family protein [unclassified Devosia]
MRKLIVGAFASLDGVMQAPGGPSEDPTGGFQYGGWGVPYFDEAVGQFMDAGFAEPYDLLLGRKTYEIFAAHWPHMPADDPIATAFNKVTKYVATRSDQEFGWINTTPLRGEVVEPLRRLKAEDGPHLLTQGSTVLVQTLLAHDLVDQLRLLSFPVLLGPGKRLFGHGTKPRALKLVSNSVSASGVSMSVYERAGEVSTGSFALAEPTAAEQARQERMAREG